VAQHHHQRPSGALITPLAPQRGGLDHRGMTRFWAVALTLLLTGCARLPDPAASAPTDARPAQVADDAIADGASPETVWRPCGTVGRAESLFALAASPDGRFLVSGNAEAGLWDLRTGTLLRTLGSDGGLKPTFSHDSRLLALAGDGRYVFRVEDGTKSLRISNGERGCISWASAAAFSPDDSRLALGSCSAVEVRALDGHFTMVLVSHVWSPGVAFSPDGRLLASSGPELWRADTGERLWPTHLEPGPPPLSLTEAMQTFTDNTVVFTPDGTRMLVSNAQQRWGAGSNEGWQVNTRLLRVEDGSVIRDYGNALDRRPSLSPDGQWVVAGAVVFQVDSGAGVTLDRNVVLSTFLPDGRIAAADRANQMTLYCPGPR
jgi:WD40 repeat protein